MLRLARHCTGMAANALALVNHKSILHRTPLLPDRAARSPARAGTG
jgi:hypothetical protein